MEIIREKLNVLLDALKTLEEGVSLFYKYEAIFNKEDTHENEQLFKSMRDSLIRRFKYCIDLFLKTKKIYLESIEKVILAANSPRGIIHKAVKARLLVEDEGGKCMDMIEARNKTPHTYHEIMAEEIAHEIPVFYELCKKLSIE